MKWLKLLGVLVALTGIGALAVAWAPSVYGQPSGRRLDTHVRRGRELTVLSGRGAEIGVRVSDAEGVTGAKIDEVEPNSPAEKAGLKRDDVIVEFDGEHVRGGRQFARIVQETPPGRTVNATVMRDGQRKEVQVTPGEGTDGASLTIDADRLRDELGNLRTYLPPFNFNFDFGMPGMMSGSRLGITVDDLTPQLAEYFGAKEGVLVTSVADGSAASRAGVKAGDVITSVNGQRVGAHEDLLRGLRAAVRETDRDVGRSGSGQPGQVDVKLGIVRDKKELTVTAKVDAARRTPRAGTPRAGRPA